MFLGGNGSMMMSPPGGATNAMLTSPPPNSSARQAERKAYSLLSPTEVHNNQKLMLLAQNQQVVQAGAQTQVMDLNVFT